MALMNLSMSWASLGPSTVCLGCWRLQRQSGPRVPFVLHIAWRWLVRLPVHAGPGGLPMLLVLGSAG